MEDLSNFRDFGQKKWWRRWNKIKRTLQKGTSEAQWKLGLIEASKMLDEVLQKGGLGVGALDDRLKRLTEEDISNLPQLFEAYGVCQDIVRDPDYRLAKEKAEEVMEIFEKTFKDLQLF